MKIKVINGDEVDYIAEMIDENITLKHSKSESWNKSTRDTKILDLVDDGNGIKIDFQEGKTFELDYSEFLELYAVMTIKHKNSNLGEDLEYLITK